MRSRGRCLSCQRRAMDEDPDALDSTGSNSDLHPTRHGPPSCALVLMSMALILAVIALVTVALADAIDDACSAWFLRPC
jgi:hypothetical protein